MKSTVTDVQYVFVLDHDQSTEYQANVLKLVLASARRNATPRFVLIKVGSTEGRTTQGVIYDVCFKSAQGVWHCTCPALDGVELTIEEGDDLEVAAQQMCMVAVSKPQVVHMLARNALLTSSDDGRQTRHNIR